MIDSSCVFTEKMEADELASCCKSLSLYDKPIPKIKINQLVKTVGAKKFRLCLAGKVFPTKSINCDGFTQNMNNIWSIKRDISIESFGDNHFIFNFY